MIGALRGARRHLLAENRFTRYLAYAAGEILLVVVGILIALQINNWNDARKDRSRELGYLRNLREDVTANIRELDRYLATRESGIATSERLLAHFDGEPIADASAFADDAISIYNWKRFYLVDNTYQDLVGSGNLATLSNPKVKDGLLDIEAMYRKLKGEEDHFRFDSETLLYRPIYRTTDLGPMMRDYGSRMGGGKGIGLEPSYFAPLLRDVEARNGFWMAILEFGAMNEQMHAMRDRSAALLADIDAELAH